MALIDCFAGSSQKGSPRASLLFSHTERRDDALPTVLPRTPAASASLPPPTPPTPPLSPATVAAMAHQRDPFPSPSLSAPRARLSGRTRPSVRQAGAHPSLGAVPAHDARRGSERRSPALSLASITSRAGTDGAPRVRPLPRRGGVHGLPRPSAWRGGSRINGSRRAHCSSVRSMLRAPPRTQPTIYEMASSQPPQSAHRALIAQALPVTSGTDSGSEPSPLQT